MHGRVSIFVLVLMLAVSFSLVGAQADLDDVNPSGQTVVYWHQWTGAQVATMDMLIETFNETNEWGITVVGVPQGSMNEVRDLMSAAITTGDLPNLVAGFQNDAQSYYLDGEAVPLDAYFEHPVWGYSGDELADLDLDIINVNRIPGEPYNDQLLLWPVGLSANVMSVNLGMLAEVGFDAPPANLEEFREIACATAELTGPDGQDIQGFPIRTNANDLESFVASAGGHIYDFETGRYDFTNDGMIEVLTFFQDLINDGCAYMPDTAFGNTDDFALGLNAMAVGSSAGVPFIQRSIDENNTGVDNWINTITPGGDNPTLQVFLTSLIMVPSTPEEQLATWLFLKYLASTEAQITWTSGTFYQPYTVSGREALTDDFLAANPQFTNTRDLLLDESVSIYSSPQILSYGDVRNVIAELVASVVVSGEDVMTAAQRQEDEANRIMEEREM
jgi:multiple sugar transport system substrate-binding protein